MADEEDQNLEYFLNKATDPSKADQDHNAVMSFCDRVNNEMEGPQVALRLLAHKMQSPQEREALYALGTVEACVQNCGGRFHQEIGKFRFLNELIKIVSPKYLGAYTSEKVKTRCIEMLFAWSSGLQHEPKIREAYSMLKKQGIVKTDPVLPDIETFEVPPPRTNTIFEDDDKSKQLARLLKSKNPEDLQAANRLIKNMVKQDIEKTEKKSKRMQELETVNNNIKLLTEMLGHYSSSSSDSDKEILKELYDSLEKRRPNLFRLASDTDEKENDAMMEILKTNDSVVKVMQQYQSVVEGKADENGLLLETDTPASQSGSDRNSAVQRSNMDELGDIFSSAQSSAGDILNLNTPPQFTQANLSSLYATGATNAATAAPPMYSATPAAAAAGALAAAPSTRADDISILDTSVTVAPPPAAAAAQTNNLSDLSGVFTSASSDSASILTGILPEPVQAQHPQGGVLQPQSVPGSQTTPSSQSAAEQRKKGGFSDLDDISYGLMKQELGDGKNAIAFVPSNVPAPKMSLNQMQTVNQQQYPNSTVSSATFPAPAQTGSVSPLIASPMEAGTGTVNVLPLTNVSVKLESIQPGAMPALTAYDKNEIKIVLHFGKDRPRPDVQVMVVSVMSTKTSAVQKFQFQAAVPKVMKVKLQPASATDLPAYNPILPSAAITQVMLVANPQNEKIRIKFKVTFTANNITETDVGDVEIPQASLL